MWGRIDDDLHTHPKWCELSLAARGLWSTVLSWTCRHKRPDVTPGVLRMLAGGDCVDLVAELVAVGMWHEAVHDCEDCPTVASGWVFHHWDRYQDKSVSEKRAEAGAKGGRAGTGDSKRRAPAKQDASNGASKSQANPQAGTPTRPVPVTPPLTLVAAVADDVEDVAGRFEEFWQAYPRHNTSGRVAGGGSKKPALAKWRKLTRAQRDACLVAVHNYRAECEAMPDRSVKHPDGWLSEERWDTYAQPAVIRARGRPAHAASDANDADRYDATKWD